MELAGPPISHHVMLDQSVSIKKAMLLVFLILKHYCNYLDPY